MKSTEYYKIELLPKGYAENKIYRSTPFRFSDGVQCNFVDVGIGSKMAIRLLSKVTLEGKKVLADKAFGFEEIRSFITQAKAVVCIPNKTNAVMIQI